MYRQYEVVQNSSPFRGHTQMSLSRWPLWIETLVSFQKMVRQLFASPPKEATSLPCGNTVTLKNTRIENRFPLTPWMWSRSLDWTTFKKLMRSKHAQSLGRNGLPDQPRCNSLHRDEPLLGCASDRTAAPESSSRNLKKQFFITTHACFKKP